MRTKFESRREQQRIAVGDSYLTGREYQVVAMYIDGVSRGEMPNKLACSLKTIDTHLQAAKHRLGANTIHQLIAMTAVADAIRGAAPVTGNARKSLPFTVQQPPELPRGMKQP